MEKNTERILKSDSVELHGCFRLGLNGPQTPQSAKPSDRSVAPINPEVHIVEKNANFALIEIICCCGTRMQVKCEYNGADLPADSSHNQTETEQTPPNQTE